MTFEALVDRMVAAFDVTQAQAVAIANERLTRMVVESTAIRAIISLGTTTSGTTSYALAANVAKVLKVQVAYTAGTAIYEGTETIEAMWDLDAGIASAPPDGYWFVIEPDTDTDATTDKLRLYPTPGESGKTITGLVALRPAALTYTSNTALPIAVNVHPALLDGCKAELSDDEDRQDTAAKLEAEYAAGIQRLLREVTGRGKGSGRHRMRVSGYDMGRMG